MSNKLFGGIAIGTAITSAIAYIYHKRSVSKLERNLTDTTKTLEDTNKRLSESIDAARNLTDVAETHAEKNRQLANTYSLLHQYNQTIINMHNHSNKVYNDIVNLDMIADISTIKNGESRNECLYEIDKALQTINKISHIDSSEVTDNEFTMFIDHASDVVSTMQKNIKSILDDIDDEDNDVETVSPERLILKCADGTTKIFVADPDDGFEVLDGSDTDNNDYCIDAQNVPKLYRFLLNSIKAQISNHHVANIDQDAFEKSIEDMVIAVSFSFINETDAEITAVSAVVPFDLFEEIDDKSNCKIYYTKNGDISYDNIIHYFGSRGFNICLENEQKGGSKVRSTSKKKKVVTQENIDVSLSNENIDFIVDAISFNRESLRSFFGKLEILLQTNNEAGTAILNTLGDIIKEIHLLIDNDDLTDENRNRISTAIKTLSTNMRKHYGNDLKRYSDSSKSKT